MARPSYDGEGHSGRVDEASGSIPMHVALTVRGLPDAFLRVLVIPNLIRRYGSPSGYGSGGQDGWSEA